MADQIKYETRIWKELPNPDNPYQAEKVFCYGYDVVDDILVNASWVEYIYLLISGIRAGGNESRLLEAIAIFIANPGVRDLSVRAAMNAGVGGAPPATVLVSALSASAGQFAGAREVALAMALWKRNLDCDEFDLSLDRNEEKNVWPDLDHIPGFDPHGLTASGIVNSCLQRFSEIAPDGFLAWLNANQSRLENHAGGPLSAIAVVAAAFCDLRLTEEQSEYLYLMLRLPGAAAHAMEQKESGWRKFPFFSDSVYLESRPAQPPLPDIEHLVEKYINESQ